MVFSASLAPRYPPSLALKSISALALADAKKALNASRFQAPDAKNRDFSAKKRDFRSEKRAFFANNVSEREKGPSATAKNAFSVRWRLRTLND